MENSCGRTCSSTKSRGIGNCQVPAVRLCGDQRLVILGAEAEKEAIKG
jgi:hypothetical protein